jgi:hypothetical protein
MSPLVDGYFRDTRSKASAAGLSVDDLSLLDSALQSLLEATHGRTPTTKYKSILKRVRSASFDLEKRLLASAGARRASPLGDAVDRLIADTLQSLVPSAALAYEQGMVDLSNARRLSWRGPATDFREALRETLDHLAPDGDVRAQTGYKPDPNTGSDDEAKGPLRAATKQIKNRCGIHRSRSRIS